jgi:membrane protein
MVELWGRAGLSWAELFRRTWKEIWRDEVFGQAARLAFYLFLAFVPSLLLLWLMLTKVAETGVDLRNVFFKALFQILPVQSSSVVLTALKQTGGMLGLRGLALSISWAFWAALNGMWALITGLNQAYEVEEGRPMWKALLVALGLMVVWSALGLVALVVAVSGARIGELIGAAGVWRTLWIVLHWVVAFAVLLIAFAILYRFGPHLERKEMQWSTPGAVIGVSLWLGSAVAFRTYLERFNSYHRIYGPLDSMAILMLWLYISGAAILIGGEVNAVIEHAAAERGDVRARAPGERVPGEKRPPQSLSN